MLINDADFVSVRIRPSDLADILKTKGRIVYMADKPCFECGAMFTPRYLVGQNDKWCSAKYAHATRYKRGLAGLDANGHPRPHRGPQI